MVTNDTEGTTLVSHLEIAEAFLRRLAGLLGRGSLQEGDGLLLRPCRDIHTFFMLFRIDVIFLDRDNKVLKVLWGLRPFSVGIGPARTCAVLELPCGVIEKSRTRVGDALRFGSGRLIDG